MDPNFTAYMCALCEPVHSTFRVIDCLFFKTFLAVKDYILKMYTLSTI